MDLPTLTISAGNGWMRQEDRFSGNIAGKEQKNYTLLHRGELSYNHGNSKLAKYGTVFSLQTYEEALVPRVYHSFKVENGSADFVEYYFATKLPDKELGKLISSGARMDGLLNIGYEEFMRIPFLFPKEEEQNKISLYFRSLDSLITLHQWKHYRIKKIINSAWEQRKLGELSEFITKGATPTTYGFEWQTSGIPFFRNDAIKNNQFVYGDYSYISEEANEVLKRSEIRANDILVAITGDIGKVGIIPKNIEKGNINQHTARVRVIKAAVPYFIYQSLCTEGQQRKYQLIKTGLSMPQLSLEQIRETVVLCPSLSEQVKIGEYFARLDHFITLHQQKYKSLKKLKKFMVKNMFLQVKCKNTEKDR